MQTHPGPRSRWKCLTGRTNDDLRAGRGNWAMGECIQKSILSPLKHDLRRGIMRTHQQRCASQGRMGTLQEGVGRDCHRWADGRWPAWWWVRARALETEVPVFKSCSLLLAVLLCADYLTSLGSSSLLLCYMGVIMPKTVTRIGRDNICKVYSIPCRANGKLESSQLL